MASCEKCGREIKNYGNECGGVRCENYCNQSRGLAVIEPKRGRPTVRGGNNPLPARQFGRISDDDWSEIKAACEAAGQSVVEWALPTLMKKARREAERMALAAK